ncbi:pseudouridine synthase [Chondromyces crocatus]|uniref:tRNA pseudouridine synthase C n=1 Tax=Chondromyces crocatus TaxID=52 RepID=A0A0K1EE05_CHOCO|nr:pseudouridine synthase [Chondromyces crocatus]AKT38932.1 pseudouridine synthase [Chondromyces crocatus]
MTGPAAPLPVLVRTDRYVAVDKPSGLAVHRGDCRDRVTALDLVRDDMGCWVYPVHRIDRGTSGVVLFALDPESAASLQACFNASTVEKRYLALVRGCPPDEGVIDHPVPKSEGGPRVPAVTDFRRLAAVERCALVEARPRTGRFHQIRRHLKHIGHPLIGDANYGKGALNRAYRDDVGLARLALHASALSFPDPWTGERVRAVAEIPDDLAAPLVRLGFHLPNAM